MAAEQQPDTTSSSGASFFAWQRRARNEWLAMNRKGPWEGYRQQSPSRLLLRALFHQKRDVWVRGRTWYISDTELEENMYARFYMCSRSCTGFFSEPTYGLKVLFVYVYKNAFVAVQSHNVTWCQKAVLILAFVCLTTSFERQPWSTASLESDWSIPADPPNEGRQPVQAVQAPIFTSNVPVPQKIELSGNLANNWKQWKQVWSA